MRHEATVNNATKETLFGREEYMRQRQRDRQTQKQRDREMYDCDISELDFTEKFIGQSFLTMDD